MTTTVFISYSHDSGPHEDRVLALANQLRDDGVDARLDQHQGHTPPEGWQQWVEEQIKTCTFVVIVFSPSYLERYELAKANASTEPDEKVSWETLTVRTLLYAAGGFNTKVIPVFFQGSVDENIPLTLRAWTSYRLPKRYDDLFRHITNQPKTPAPRLGKMRKLEPAPRPSLFGPANANGGTATPRAPETSPTPATPSEQPAPRHEASTHRLMLPALPDDRITIVVFTANGAEPRPRLRLAKELRAIRRVLEAPHLRERVRLEICSMASFADVIRVLDELQPTAVHFSGHTDLDSGHLVLESQDAGDEAFVSPEQLSSVLGELARKPTLITFTACASTKLAEAMAQHAQYAIGFDGEYFDDWAPLFSSTLYERLTSHAELDVPRALKLTKLTWQSEGQDVAGQSRLFRGQSLAQPHDTGRQRPPVATATTTSFGDDASATSTTDVLLVTALKEELDALLAVDTGLREPWRLVDGTPPVHVAVFDGEHGPIRITAARQTQMGSLATATLVLPLIDALHPRCLAMCGVCAGEPGDTDRGDVVIADRVFQYDQGKTKPSGFQGDLWVNPIDDDWLRVAQDLAGPADGFRGYAVANEDHARWWFLEQLRDGRDPLRSVALRRYVPDARRAEMLESYVSRGDVAFRDGVFSLTEAGRESLASHLAIHGTLVGAAPYHVHVAPMGSGNAVAADGEVWRRLVQGGMRKAIAVEMEVATIGEIARKRALPFAVAKGVMDHGDEHKTDRYKAFAAQAAAEVLCELLRRVVVPGRVETVAR